MKKNILVLLVFIICCTNKESQPEVLFKKYDESADLVKQQNHESGRMKFKLFQSKRLDMNDVFKPFQKDLSQFSEENYNELKPLILEQDIPTLQKSVKLCLKI